MGEPPGSISVAHVAPSAERGAWTHHLTPAALAGLARTVSGRSADVVVVSIGVESTEPGHGLSHAVADAVPVASARSSPTWCWPMHEVSLVAELVEACERLADGAPVRRVRVRHASSLPRETVRQAFALLTSDTPLGGARLELSSFDVEVRCACGFVGALDHDEPTPGRSSSARRATAWSRRPRTPELELVAVVT